MGDLNENWDEVVKKEARGIDNSDLGEVQVIKEGIVVTKKGVLDKNEYHLPKRFVDRYDGRNLFFKITKSEADQYRRHEEFL